MRKLPAIIFICPILMISAFTAFSYDSETKKIMPFVDDKSYCKKCHSMRDLTDVISDPSKSCDIYCLTCHKEITPSNHHPIKVKMVGNVGHDFRYSKFKKLMCITCHDLHKERFDSSPWESQSLFDMTFKNKKKYNTYYLPIKNSKGQLCKTCH